MRDAQCGGVRGCDQYVAENLAGTCSDSWMGTSCKVVPPQLKMGYNPINYIDISPINHSYWTYKPS